MSGAASSEGTPLLTNGRCVLALAMFSDIIDMSGARMKGVCVVCVCVWWWQLAAACALSLALSFLDLPFLGGACARFLGGACAQKSNSEAASCSVAEAGQRHA